jgi:DNA-binding CsgD family transcriptional regulator
MSVESLTDRERDVLRLLAQGHTNREVAELLGLSVKTVETYRARLSNKLGLRGRAAIFRFAYEEGLLDHDRS